MVVVDNNVLSSLSKINRLGLLNRLFDDPVTASSVIDELHRDEIAGFHFTERIDDVKSYNGGWLHVVSLSEDEIELAERIVDSSLSFTDAECIAVAQSRDKRLLTDDGHVGEMATQRGVDVWDLKLLLEASIYKDLVQTRDELEAVVTALREEDNYRFSGKDRDDLFERL